MPRKPIPLDDTRRRRLLDALTCGATLKLAAAAAGVSDDTLARWRKRYPELQDEIDQAEATGAVAALATIRQAAQGGTWQAAAWILERRYPSDYGRPLRVAPPDVPPGPPQSDPEADRRLARIIEQTAAQLSGNAGPF